MPRPKGYRVSPGEDPGGRPSVLENDPKLQERIAECFLLGLTDEQTALDCDISERTIRTYACLLRGGETFRQSFTPAAQLPMGLGTKNRQKQTADICKQHLREKYPGKLGLVEEFIVEIEGPPKDCDVTRWGKFTDIRDIKKEMFECLEVQFENWLNS